MKKLTMVATLLLLCLGAVAQPMRRPQGPLNEFSAMEWHLHFDTPSYLKYN